MIEEFNLSGKRINDRNIPKSFFLEEDVKKCIKIIVDWGQEHIDKKALVNPEDMLEVIKWSAGKDLI